MSRKTQTKWTNRKGGVLKKRFLILFLLVLGIFVYAVDGVTYYIDNDFDHQVYQTLESVSNSTFIHEAQGEFFVVFPTYEMEECWLTENRLRVYSELLNEGHVAYVKSDKLISILNNLDGGIALLLQPLQRYYDARAAPDEVTVARPGVYVVLSYAKKGAYLTK